MLTKPRVSVMVPTFNYAHFICDALDSIMAQTYTDYEVIIMDNCSTDNTEAVIRKYLSDPRVKYLKNDRNLGVVGNWNKCLENASAEFIKIVCADDKIHPTMLEKYVKIMDEHPSVAIVTCDKLAFGSKTHETITPLTHLQNGNKSNLHMLCGLYCWIGEPTSTMFRKSHIEKIGLFTDQYRQYVDWEMWTRLLTLGDCYIVPELLAYVRFHGQSISKTNAKLKFVLCFEEYKLVKDVQSGKYAIDTRGSSIDAAVRDRALRCINLALLGAVPKLHKKEAREAFKRAFAIAKTENLIPHIFLEFFGGIKRKTFRLVNR